MDFVNKQQLPIEGGRNSIAESIMTSHGKELLAGISFVKYSPSAAKNNKTLC